MEIPPCVARCMSQSASFFHPTFILCVIFKVWRLHLWRATRPNATGTVWTWSWTTWPACCLSQKRSEVVWTNCLCSGWVWATSRLKVTSTVSDPYLYTWFCVSRCNQKWSMHRKRHVKPAWAYEDFEMWDSMCGTVCVTYAAPSILVAELRVFGVSEEEPDTRNNEKEPCWDRNRRARCRARGVWAEEHEAASGEQPVFILTLITYTPASGGSWQLMRQICCLSL